MRRGLTGVVVVALAMAVNAQEQPPLDRVVRNFQLPGVLPPCGIATAVYKLARQTGILVGFERVPGCTGSASFPTLDTSVGAETDDGLKARDVLDRLMAIAPDYSWQEMDGVAVIRPRSAWADPNDGLNVRVRAFRADDAPITHMLATILDLPDRTGGDSRRFTVDFAGGTIADALNTIVKAQPAALWDVSLLIHTSPSGEDRSPSFMISVMTLPAGPGIGMGTPLPRLFGRR